MNQNFANFTYLYEALANKKGQDIVALDLENFSMVADIFIMVTGNSETHLRTLVDAADEALSKNGISAKIEGGDSPNWRLVDGGNVLVHVFSRKGRELYRIEKIWGEAESFSFETED